MSIPKEIQDDVEKIIAKRGNPVLLLSLPEVKKGAALLVHDLLCKKTFANLDVVLQTPGGDIDAAFLLAKILKEKAGCINIFVPLYAKSAGTLICLCADQIIMTDLSELGPLDTQIFEQQDGGSSGYTSALNGFKALEQVQLHAIETLDITTKMILARSQMKISEAVHLAAEFAGHTSGTLYSKLNPHKIGEYARALEIGEQYGIMVLTRYRGWQQNQAERAVKILVKQYPSHGFIIDQEELVSLGLPAIKIQNDLLDTMITLRQNLLKAQDESIIKLIEPPSAPAPVPPASVPNSTPSQNIPTH